MTPAAASSVLLFVADAALRALVFAAAAGITLKLFRVSSTSVRISVWTTVLVAALVMPLAGRVLPTVTWNLPAWTMNAVAPAAASRPAASVASSGVVEASMLGSSWLSSLATTWPAWLLGVYLAGVLALLLRAFLSWRMAVRLERDARPIVDESAQSRLRHLVAAGGVPAVPVLAESTTLRVPVATSVIAPAILLPAAWKEWSAARLDAVLAHELGHVARRDVLIQRVSLIHRAIFWFSPLAWWLHRELTELAELASDEAALEAGADRTDYAETLLAFFAELRHMPRLGASTVAMARDAAAIAERRLDRILMWKGDRSMKLTKRLLLGFLFAAAPVAALTAAAQPVVASSKPVVAVAPAVKVAPAAVPAPVASEAVPQDPPPPPPPPAPPRVVQRMPPPPPPPPPPPMLVLETPDDQFGKGAYASDTPGLSLPVVIRQSEAKYTSDALRAKIQGEVDVEFVVAANGTVTQARISKDPSANPLHNAAYSTTGIEEQAVQLQNEAIRAVRGWQFSPATLNDKPVPAIVKYTVSFRIH